MIGLHFPFRFDPQLLRADLSVARALPWAAHYNERDFGGNWSGIALRSATGNTEDLIAAPPGNPIFRDTTLLEHCPNFRHVLSIFECPLKAVRLLSLAPQSFIREHSDHALGYDDGEIRIHVPIETNADVEFYVAGQRLLLEEGHSYFVNVNLPHRVNNRGTADRVHLVIDADVNEWVHALFRRGETECWGIPRSSRPPRNIDDFRRRVLSEPALQQQLQAFENRAGFTAAAMQLGRDPGYDFHDGDIDAAMRSEPLADTGDDPPGAGWTPVRVFFRERAAFAEWIWTGAQRFTLPFFESSVRAARRHPFTQLFRRELPLVDIPKSAAPAGFIFHVSRCGSTLVSQMLAASASHRMISEAPPVDEVLQAHHKIPDLTHQEQIVWLRRIVQALGVGASGEESRLFIKLDAWHISSLPLIREAFPETPWVFLYRDPVEVVVSQMSRPGKIALPGAMDPAIFGLRQQDITGLSREQWCTEALAGFYRAGFAAVDTPGGLFVDYRDLPNAVFDTIARHFGISVTDAELAGMRDVTVFDAKNPALNFEPDSDSKQTQASGPVREACEVLLNPIYRALVSSVATGEHA